jgi:hypothetical protein
LADPADANPPQASATASSPKKKVAVLRAEIAIAALFVLLGTSAWMLVGGKLAALSRRYEPREEQLRARHEVPWKQDSLAMTEAEQKATQEQLIQSRLGFYKSEAALEAFDAVPRPVVKGDDKAAPPQTREDLLQSREAAGRSMNALIERLGLLQSRANELRAEVEERRWRAAAEFRESHMLYSLVKLAVTFLVTTLVLLAVYWALLIPLRHYETRASESGYETNRRLVLKTAGGVVLVLIAYQTFQVAGAAFAGVLVLLFFLSGMPWPDRRAASQK